MPVAAVQPGARFRKEHPCPICRGWDGFGAPRGKGERCFGFMGADGKYAHCSREEHAGPLVQEDGGTYAHRLEGPCKCGTTHGEEPLRMPRTPTNGTPTNGQAKPAPPAAQAVERNKRESGHWDYETGLRVVRVDFEDEQGRTDKRYVQRHRHADGTYGYGISRRDGCPADCVGAARTLYRAAELRAADPSQFVFFVEGEKCADRLVREGCVATTAPGGAKSWKATSEIALQALAGRHVVVLPDRDTDGEAFAAQVSDALAPVTASLRRLDLPGLAEGEDVVEWLDLHRHDVEDLVKLADALPNLSARFQPQTVEQILCSSSFAAPQLTFSTGILRLDELLDGGFKARQVTGIAAPTGAGKTAFGCEIARSLREVRPILYVSTEIEAEEIAARIAGPAIGARASDILSLRTDPRRAAAAVAGWPIFPFELEENEEKGPVERIEAQIAVITKFTGQTPIVIVDYLQDLVSEDGDRRRGAVSRIARRLRQLARRCDTPIIAISSVARALYSATGRKVMQDEDDPRAWLASAKESGDIEYSAAVFIYLDTSTDVAPDGFSAARLIVAKSRRGRVGFVGMRFHGPTGRFFPHDAAVEEMGSQRKALEIEKKVMEAAQRAAKSKATVGKDELAKAVGGNKGEAGKAIDRLVATEKLALVDMKRPDKAGRMRAFQAVVLPEDHPALPVEQG